MYQVLDYLLDNFIILTTMSQFRMKHICRLQSMRRNTYLYTAYYWGQATSDSEKWDLTSDSGPVCLKRLRNKWLCINNIQMY